MSAEPIHRTTARVIPVNDAGEVLLLQGHDPARPDRPYWFSIGGGTEAGETPAETAAREMAEETGVDVTVEQLGEPFRREQHDYSYNGLDYTAESTYFALRLDAVQFTFDGAGESEIITGAAWFGLADLAHTTVSNGALPDIARLAVEHLRTAGAVAVMPQKHSRPVVGGRGFWWTENLWRAAAGLPVAAVPIEQIAELDQDCWFDGRAPTCREVARHVRRIEHADLGHPIILAANGGLMDGGHRIARAWLDGRTVIDAVRFTSDPEPDWVVLGEA